MSRPEFPRGIVLTPEIISRIRSDQETYDKCPEYWDRLEKEREEREMEERDRERGLK